MNMKVSFKIEHKSSESFQIEHKRSEQDRVQIN